jgi:hypothetical protein
MNEVCEDAHAVLISLKTLCFFLVLFIFVSLIRTIKCAVLEHSIDEVHVQHTWLEVTRLESERFHIDGHSIKRILGEILTVDQVDILRLDRRGLW